MEVNDLKEKIIPQVGVRYDAIEAVPNFDGVVHVNGSDSEGWKVWVEENKENGRVRSTCINPKNSKGEIGKYKTSSLAIGKANHFIKNHSMPMYKKMIMQTGGNIPSITKCEYSIGGL